MLRDSTEHPLRLVSSDIDWSERLVCIWGPKGVGKTTLLISRLRLAVQQKLNVLYVSLDHPHFSGLSLLDLANAFSKTGGEILLLDEVHKYEGWSSNLKAIYDSHPALKVVYSGSSALHLHQGGSDLSRRAALFKLPILSLREFTSLATGVQLGHYSLRSIQDDHISITTELIQKFKPIEHLQAYLRHGAYPFFQDGLTRYQNKLVNVINETLDVDLAFVHGLDPRYSTKLKGVLRMVAESVPFAPKVTDLAQALSISRPTVSQYLEYLQEGGLITMVRGVGRGYQKLSKPEKIYLDNTNLAYAMGGNDVDVGAARETFLVSQLKEAGHLVETHSKADFVVNELTTIEVGGPNKKRSQITGIPDAFRVIDGVETGSKGQIPLWLFGFLY